MSVRFGEFTFDGAAQELRRGAEVVHLPPKAMRLLEILLARRGEVVTRGELIARIWPDVTVSEASLKNLVSNLRVALGDHARKGRYVQNVHERGYRFTDSVIELGEEPVVRALLRCGGRRFPLRDGTLTVGRGRACEIVVDDPSVSRRHARLVVSADAILIEDLGSRNGTAVDGVRIEGVRPLPNECEIRFGRVDAWLSAGAATPSTADAP